jgi:pyruvate dehydrogenase kinase 2/3/4
MLFGVLKGTKSHECCELQQVRDWYVTSFKDLRSFPDIQDMEDETRFTNLISRVKARHNEVMPTMAMGIQELKEDLGRKVGLNELPEIHEFLDRFYMSRIGIRMLIGKMFIMSTLPTCLFLKECL